MGLAHAAAGSQGKAVIVNREGVKPHFEPAYVYEVLLEAVTATVLDFYIQVQLSGTSGRKWRARSNHTPKTKKKSSPIFTLPTWSSSTGTLQNDV